MLLNSWIMPVMVPTMPNEGASLDRSSQLPTAGCQRNISSCRSSVNAARVASSGARSITSVIIRCMDGNRLRSASSTACARLPASHSSVSCRRSPSSARVAGARAPSGPGNSSRMHNSVRSVVVAELDTITAASEPPSTITPAWGSNAEMVVSARSPNPNHTTKASSASPRICTTSTPSAGVHRGSRWSSSSFLRTAGSLSISSTAS
jgi:hypothetical protein